MMQKIFPCLVVCLVLVAAPVTAQHVKVDVNLDMKHSVRGVSKFDREKHITVHANVSEADWKGEDVAKHYLMNELDVYFGRDNGNASWFFGYTPQDPSQPGRPDITEIDALNKWWSAKYRDEGRSATAYEHRAGQLIMGTNPGAVLPSNNYRQMLGREDQGGKYILRDSEASAEWVAEYLQKFFRSPSNLNAQLRPMYWEVTNEPDMILNTRDHFFLSSWEQIFQYHNLVASKVRDRLGDRAPLIGGMTWGLHDLGSPDYWHRANGEEERRKLVSQYYRDPDSPDAKEGDRVAWQRVYDSTKSDIWEKDVKQPFAQWDYIWKGFVDAAGENMDFYAMHFYDWVSNGETPDTLSKGKYRYGGSVEAVLEMIEWYQQHRFGEAKPWVISEYGSIVGGQHSDTDYRWGDWTHVQSFNWMFMQFLRRPDMIVKSMPFAPIKGTWGYRGDLRYEPSLMQTDAPYADISKPETDWYFSDKIHWYQLWSGVQGTRVDTSSTEPDIQVDAYVDGQQVFLILNNMEWQTTSADLSFLGAGDNAVVGVRMKHSYLGKGLSRKTPGRGVLADATLDALPETVVIPAGSTIILEVEYKDPIAIRHQSNEIKYYGESLSGAGQEAGAVHRVNQQGNEFVVAHVHGVKVPQHGEAVLRVTGQFHGRHMTYHRPHAAGFRINGHEIWPRVEMRGEKQTEECYDFLGLDYHGTQHSYLRSFDIPVPLEYLLEDNEIQVRVQGGGTYANVNIIVWDMSRETPRSQQRNLDRAVAVSGVSVPDGDLRIGVNQSAAIQPTVLPGDASNKTFDWMSEDLNVAIVDANGIVTGVGQGTTTIKGVTTDGSFEALKSVTVTSVAPTGVNIMYGNTEIFVGGTQRLFAYVAPWLATNKTVTWSSEDTSVATIDSDGVVTGVGPGATTISATTLAGKLDAHIQIEVTTLHVQGMSTQPDFAVLPMGDSIQINATWTPVDASNRIAQWTSSDPSIAVVDAKGRVTGRSVGTVKITAVADDGGFMDSTTVEVASVDAKPFFVEAEKLHATGGTFQGFKINSELGNINYNQTGDWAEYKVHFPAKGTYQCLLDTGSPLDGAGVEIFVDKISAGVTSLPNTGNWDKMQRTVVSNGLAISKPGVYTIRIQSVGKPDAWQWNADKIGFRKLTSNVATATDTTPN